MENWLALFPKVMLFIILWSIIMLLIAAGAGWRSLAEFYRADHPFEGKKFYFQSVRLRYGMGYNHILTIGANVEGIYIWAPFPFAIGHPPLFLPWHDVSATTRRTWWADFVLMEFSKCPSIPIGISPRLADKLVEASAGRFIKEEGTK